MLEQFKWRHKDYVMLINEELKQSYDFVKIKTKIQQSLELIFDNFIEVDDRISLITYGKNVKKLFNLVGYNKNQVQLRNQIKQLEFVEDPKPDSKASQNVDGDVEKLFPRPGQSDLLKALKEVISEFVEGNGGPNDQLKNMKDRNTQVLLLFTSKFDLTRAFRETPDELDKVIFDMHALKINVIIFGYEIGLSRMEQASIKDRFNDFEEPDQVLRPRTYDEQQVFKFVNRLLTFNP